MNRYHKFNRRQPKPARARNEQAIILAGLNLVQALEDTAPQFLQDRLYYGSDTFTGKNYASALVWHRRKGYQHYRELTLSGVWLVANGDVTDIHIGSKTLLYQATIYNAESYHSVMKQSFKPYYGDDTSPPADRLIFYRTVFDITQRVALRKELKEQIILFLKNQQSAP